MLRVCKRGFSTLEALLLVGFTGAIVFSGYLVATRNDESDDGEQTSVQTSPASSAVNQDQGSMPAVEQTESSEAATDVSFELPDGWVQRSAEDQAPSSVVSEREGLIIGIEDGAGHSLIFDEATPRFQDINSQRVDDRQLIGPLTSVGSYELYELISKSGGAEFQDGEELFITSNFYLVNDDYVITFEATLEYEYQPGVDIALTDSYLSGRQSIIESVEVP